MGGVVTAYYIFARTTEYDFKFLELGVIANLFFLIFLLKDRVPQKVEDPISFVRFSGGKLKFSEVSVSIDKVQKIALEVVGEDCYFTLPYNQT